MQQEFTRDFMQANCGCYKETKNKLDDCSFMKSETISLYSILQSEIPLRDKFWFVCKKLASKEENQKIAIAVAEIVLPIYEKRYPENKAPREAIEAAKQYIAGHISLEDLMIKRRAAADAAADAAYVADAAADAAYVAYVADAAYDAAYVADAAYAAYVADAAYVAAYVADAAYDAAYVADAAADAAADDTKQQLLSFLQKFCITDNNKVPV